MDVYSLTYSKTIIAFSLFSSYSCPTEFNNCSFQEFTPIPTFDMNYRTDSSTPTISPTMSLNPTPISTPNPSLSLYETYFTGYTAIPSKYQKRTVLKDANNHIQDCIFKFLSSTDKGGAIFYEVNSIAHLLVEDCVFYQTKSRLISGAIYFHGSLNGGCVLYRVCGSYCMSEYNDYCSGRQFGIIVTASNKPNVLEHISITRCNHNNGVYVIETAFGNQVYRHNNISNNRMRECSGFTVTKFNSLSQSHCSIINNTETSIITLYYYGGSSTGLFETSNVIGCNSPSGHGVVCAHSGASIMITKCVFLSNLHRLFYLKSGSLSISQCGIYHFYSIGHSYTNCSLTNVEAISLYHFDSILCNYIYSPFSTPEQSPMRTPKSTPSVIPAPPPTIAPVSLSNKICISDINPNPLCPDSSIITQQQFNDNVQQLILNGGNSGYEVYITTTATVDLSLFKGKTLKIKGLTSSSTLNAHVGECPNILLLENLNMVLHNKNSNVPAELSLVIDTLTMTSIRSVLYDSSVTSTTLNLQYLFTDICSIVRFDQINMFVQLSLNGKIDNLQGAVATRSTKITTDDKCDVKIDASLVTLYLTSKVTLFDFSKFLNYQIRIEGSQYAVTASNVELTIGESTVNQYTKSTKETETFPIANIFMSSDSVLSIKNNLTTIPNNNPIHVNSFEGKCKLILENPSPIEYSAGSQILAGFDSIKNMDFQMISDSNLSIVTENGNISSIEIGSDSFIIKNTDDFVFVPVFSGNFGSISFINQNIDNHLNIAISRDSEGKVANHIVNFPIILAEKSKTKLSEDWFEYNGSSSLSFETLTTEVELTGSNGTLPPVLVVKDDKGNTIDPKSLAITHNPSSTLEPSNNVSVIIIVICSIIGLCVISSIIFLNKKDMKNDLSDSLDSVSSNKKKDE